LEVIYTVILQSPMTLL